MADYLGSRAVNSTVRFSFTTHAQTGAAVAPSSGFENADLRIYKDGSATQRSSASGITMTSPFDSVTGVHHVDIDLSDNTDSGFYAAGSFYEVHLVPDETVDGLAVVRVLAYFDIGVPVANVTQFGGTAGTFSGGRPEVNTSHLGGTSQTGRDVGASVLLSPGSGTGQVDLSSGKVLLQPTQAGVTIPTVTTLTNAPSDSSGVTTLLGKLTGITSLAQWLGLLAGKQTGNSTARTELRATGAGSGAFDEATDSLEALRDEVAAVKTETDKLADTLEDQGGGTYGFTEAALQEAPSGGGGGPSAEEIADEVATRSLIVGTNNDKTGYGLADSAITEAKIANNAITDAKVASDVTIASVTGAVGSVSGNIGGNVVGSVGSLATQAKADVNAEVDAALADYDPPTRAEATSDANSILSKLLKYVQLILRKDSAIATDNATEVTAINANGGSGAGTFANTTDAQEAIRDRGDAAWTTATGFSTHSAADVWAVGTRTLTSFGTLVSEVATAVWVATERTLSAFAFTPSLHPDYDAAKGAAQVSDIPTPSDNAAEVLAAAAADPIAANVKEVNDEALTGDGTSGNPWGPA